MTEILPIPALPPGIKDAVNSGKLAIFVGAGASRLMGCMGWDQLARNLVDACHNAGSINFKEKEALEREPDHRKTITICHHIMVERGGNAPLFYEHMGRALKQDEQLARDFPLYEQLYKLRALCVTTNADELFAQFYNPESIVCHRREFRGEDLDATKLYHLHGIVRDRDSIVFRLEEYIRHYRDINVQRFLQALFSSFTVLFVGYGLTEFQLLEYVIMGNGVQSSELRHYLLMPLYQGEENILEFEQAYYSRLGIQVVAYDKTINGYHQLFEVIKAWQLEINRVTASLLNAYELIEQALSNYSEEMANKVFQLILHDTANEDHFFKLVSDAEWLLPLRTRGYFEPSKNPRPVEVQDSPGYFTIPQWNVLGYLERVAGQLNLDDTEKLEILMQVIRAMCDYRDDRGSRIENYRTDWTVVKVLSKSPAAVLQAEDFTRIAECLKTSADLVGPEIVTSLLPHVIAAGNRVLLSNLVSVLFAYRWKNVAGSEEPVALIESYCLGEAVQKYLAEICRLIPLDVAQSTLSLIEEIVHRDRSSFSIFTILSIKKVGWDDGYRWFDKLIVRVARDSLDAASDQAPVEVQGLVRDLLQKDHSIFRRLALSVFASKWHVLAVVFWEQAGDWLFSDPSLRPEIRHLARLRFATFSDAEKEKWVNWIESAPYQVPGDLAGEPEELARYLAWRKLNHLGALKSSGDQRAIDLYRRYVQVVGHEPEDAEMEGRSEPAFFQRDVGRLVPQLRQLSTPDLIAELESAPIGSDRFRYEDMSLALREVVQTAPDRFVSELSAFAQVPLLFQASIIVGLSAGLKASREFEWTRVLHHCLNLAKDEGFWADYEGNADKQYLVSQIAELIAKGMGQEAGRMGPECLPLVEDILLELLRRTPSSVREGEALTTQVLNSVRGIVLEGLMMYSFRMARTEGRTPDDRWEPSVRDEFTRRLDRSFDNTLEFSFTLGWHLPNLYHLDRAWVSKNINRILPKKKKLHWRATFAAFLTQPKLYWELYDLLRSSNHYAEALRTNFRDQNVTARLWQHVCLAYLQGREPADRPGSLFESLVSRWDPIVLRDAAWFFWTQRSQELEPGARELIIAFWERVAQHYEHVADPSQDEKRLLARLLTLAVYLDEIGEESLRRLKLGARYVEADHQTPALVEQLYRLADVSPKEVGEVYLDMLGNSVFPTYNMTHILSCMEKLYGAGQHDLANAICNLYLRRGYDAFRDTFVRHNQ